MVFDNLFLSQQKFYEKRVVRSRNLIDESLLSFRFFIHGLSKIYDFCYITLLNDSYTRW